MFPGSTCSRLYFNACICLLSVFLFLAWLADYSFISIFPAPLQLQGGRCSFQNWITAETQPAAANPHSRSNQAYCIWIVFFLLFTLAHSLLMSLQRATLINIFLFHFLFQSSFSTFQITVLKAQLVQCKAFKNEKGRKEERLKDKPASLKSLRQVAAPATKVWSSFFWTGWRRWEETEWS